MPCEIVGRSPGGVWQRHGKGKSADCLGQGLARLALEAVERPPTGGHVNIGPFTRKARMLILTLAIVVWRQVHRSHRRINSGT